MGKIKVAVVDDDPDWLESIEIFLRNYIDISIIGTAKDRLEILELVEKSCGIDIVLLDVKFEKEKCNGVYIAAELMEYDSNIKIIMLTSSEEEKTIIDSFTAGAINYVLKIQYQQIPQIIRNVSSNQCPTEILAKNFAIQQKEKMLNVLTKSEKEILNLIQQGYPQSKIAKTLYKTQGTLRCQINKIIKKLGVRDSKEAAKKIAFRGFYNSNILL